VKLLTAFFRLIRWPNLVFIILTQYLFYSCIINPITSNKTVSLPVIPGEYFWLLSLSSVLIAAAGYIINDYFDLNIDRINKPGRLIIGETISRRWAMLWHIVISFIGILIGFYIGLKIFPSEKWLIGIANLICALLLVLYSTTFKKQLLIGNIIISLLTAWVIFIVTIVLKHVSPPGNVADAALSNTNYLRVLKFTFLYGSFAFIISLIREVIKDIEDMEGDAKYNCKTMPIVWGIPVAKVFAGVWIIVLTGALVIIQFYVLQIGWWPSSLYCLLLIIVPLCWILKKLYEAQTTQQYHQLSTAVKLVMLAGILSMIFLKIL
jgi:4-hydroxybenzoate polyprenyltransferase